MVANLPYRARKGQVEMKHWFWFLAAGLSAAADPLSGPGRQTLIQEPWGTVFAEEKALVRSDPQQRQFQVEGSAGRVLINRTPQGWNVVGPRQGLRLEVVPESGGQRLTVRMGAQKYQLLSTPSQFSYQESGKRWTYQVEGETSMGVEGSLGSLSIASPKSEFFQVSSSAGHSEIERNGNWLQVEGPSLKSHPYCFRAILFEVDGVGLQFRLPGGPLLPQLSWDYVYTVRPPETTARRQEAPVYLKPPDAPPEADPLQLKGGPFQSPPNLEDTLKKPAGAGWQYPPGAQQVPSEPMKAIEAPKGQDPLGIKRKPFERSKTLEEAQKEQEKKP